MLSIDAFTSGLTELLPEPLAKRIYKWANGSATLKTMPVKDFDTLSSSILTANLTDLVEMSLADTYKSCLKATVELVGFIFFVL